MSGPSSLYEIETLFIEKLQEKYKLTLRDLKKAFSRFDLDGNGLLDLYELTQGMKLFLNGIKESQVKELVANYDVNGDGKISYEEFLHFLNNRSAIDEEGYSDAQSQPYSESYLGSEASYPNAYPASMKNNYFEGDQNRAPIRGGNPPRSRQHHQPTTEVMKLPHGGRPQSQPRRDYYEDDRHSEITATPSDTSTRFSEASVVPSSLNAGNPKQLESRAKIYIENLRTNLLRRAWELRLAGKVNDPSTMHLGVLQETVARNILMKLFQPYSGQGDGRTKSRVSGVEINEFAKVLRGFSFPGTGPIRIEVIRFLFELCSYDDDDAPLFNEEGRPVADSNAFVDLVFGTPVARQDRRQRGLKEVGKRVTTNEDDTEGFRLKGYVARMNNGRQEVGSGPVRLDETIDASGAPVKGATVNPVVTNSLAVPLRFVSRKSKSALTVPSNFDPQRHIPLSNSIPPYELSRKHVFGISGSIHSGNALQLLPSTPKAFQAYHENRNSKRPQSGRRDPQFIDPATIVYASAALGVVHNLGDNSQLFFNVHDDDISCLTVSADGTLAATGCVGKNPVVLVWETDFAPEHGQNAVAVIGEGFFYRGVCAVQFSWDKKHIIGISCDDYHQIGIFSLTTGKLICQAPGQHGIPPQIRWLAYCPAQQHVQFITREHSGLCDMFATAGVNHLKIWSFKRPAYTAMSLGGQDADDASLVSRGCTVGKSTSLPKCFSCCGFVPCDNGDYDFCAGASNGFVYMWKIGNLVAHQQVIKGGRVQCLEVKGSRIFCGGAGGNLVVIDARTLRPLMSFSLLSSQPSPRGSTAKSGGRPSSMNKRPQSAPRPGMSRGKTNAGQQQKAADDSTTGPTEESGALVITGLVVVQPGGATSRDKMMAGSTYVIASLGTGKTVRVEIGAAKPLQNNFMVSNPKEKKQPSNIISNAPDPGQEKGPPPAGRDLFYFHTGPVYGLAADVTSNCKYIATVGDDRKLFLWDVRTKSGLKLAGCAVLQTPARCCHLDKFNSFIAVGMTNGAFSVYFRSDHIYPSVFQPSANANPRGGAASKNEVHVLYEVGFRKDSKLEITEIKFSPSNEILATGGRDDTICVYKCELAVESQGFGREMRDVGTCLLQPLHRMRGHSSSITHLDWSYDSKLILSTSAAYELLCWDVDAGRQFNKVNVADIKWKTNHCILGFSVMGIWPPYSDGTDVNALDVSHEKNLVITANDQDGLVKLFNYPCVVKNPPERSYTGHSSHVSNIKFMKGADFAISVGGNDRSVVLWEVITARDLKRINQILSS